MSFVRVFGPLLLRKQQGGKEKGKDGRENQGANKHASKQASE